MPDRAGRQEAAELRRQIEEQKRATSNGKESSKRWRWITLVAALGAITATVLLIVLTSTPENVQPDYPVKNQLSAANNGAGDAQKESNNQSSEQEDPLPIPPTIQLECPNDTKTSASVREASFGATWNWSDKAGFGSITIQYGDGTVFTANSGEEAKSKAFKHQYRQPGVYTASVSIEDGVGQTAKSDCTWSWTKASSKKSATSQASTSSNNSSVISSVLTRSYTWLENSFSNRDRCKQPPKYFTRPWPPIPRTLV